MAGSRLEKIGTIYTRTSGLIKSGALRWEDRPLWYDIYEAFPPKEEPRFDRPTPKLPIRKIFYEEDKIRALFHRHNKHVGAANLSDNRYKSLTQRFVENYGNLLNQYGGQASEEQLYQEAVGLLKREKEAKRDDEEDSASLSSAFKEATEAQTDKKPQPPGPSLNIKVSDILKD